MNAARHEQPFTIAPGAAVAAVYGSVYAESVFAAQISSAATRLRLTGTRRAKEKAAAR